MWLGNLADARFLSEVELSASQQHKRRLFEGLILLCLGAYLLVDTVNGLFVSIGLPNVVSALFKQGLLVILLLFALQFEPRRFFWCLCCLLAILVWALLRFFLVDDLDFLYAFQESIKVIYLFVIVLVVSTFHSLSPLKLHLILLAAIGVVAINVIFSLAGFGLSTYQDFGAKGFFYSGNALSGVIVICASFLLMKAFNQSVFRFAMITLVLSAVALLIGTKGGFLGVLICALITMLFNLNLRTMLYGVLVIVGATALVLAFWEQLQQNPLYERVIFFYENGGLTRVIFSGRDGKLMRIWPVLIHADLAQWLLGLDMSDMLRVAGIRRAEFDWFDMQITFGVLLSLLVYGGYVAIFARLLIAEKNYIVLAAICAFLVLFMVSSIAGHVLYNGMVTPLWAVLTAAALNPELAARYNLRAN